jgi:outer membrane autotransporter protein
VNGTLTLDGPSRVSMFYDLKIDYDKTHVYFDVANTTPFDSVAQTRNQKAAAEGIYSVKSGSLFNAIGYLNSPAEARQAYDAISGEAYASARTVLMEDSRLVRDAFVLRLNDAEDASVEATMPLGYAPTAKSAFPLKDEAEAATANSAVWAQGFDNWGSTASDGNAKALKRQTSGMLLGYDTLLADLVRVGIGGGFSETTFGVLDRASNGSAENFHLGLYGGTRLNGFGVKFGAAYSWNDVSVSRTAAFSGASNLYYPGYSNKLTGKTADSTAQIFGDFSYRYLLGAAQVEPFDSIAYVNVHGDPFTESGGAAALHGISGDTVVTYNTIGVRGAYAFNLGEVISTVRGEFGWKHAFGDIAPAQPFNFAGGSIFTIAGVPVAQEALAVKGGVDVALTEALFVAARYDGQFAKAANDQSVKGAMAYKF